MDYSEYEMHENVPIFYEIATVDSEGNPIVYDANQLRKIVHHNNLLIRDGEHPSITVGHYNGSNNPASVGLVDKFSIGMRNNVMTVFMNAHMQKGKSHLLTKDYPKRSIEIKRDHLTIPAVALLGSNPALNLGEVFSDIAPLQLYAEKTFSQPINKDNDMQSTPEFKAMVLECLEGTDVWSFYKDLMDKEIEYIHDEEPMDQKSEEHDEVKLDDHKEEEHKEEEPKKMSAESPAEKEVEEKEAEGADSEKYSSLLMEVRELRGKLRHQEREKSLMKLANEGYDIDVQAELDDSLDLDDPSFQKHVLGKITKFAAKAPLHIMPPENIQLVANTPPTDKQAREIANYSAKTGCGYEAACKHFNVQP